MLLSITVGFRRRQSRPAAKAAPHRSKSAAKAAPQIPRFDAVGELINHGWGYATLSYTTSARLWHRRPEAGNPAFRMDQA